MPVQFQQDAVAAYFTEAKTPTVIGVTEAQALILETVENVGRVLEQVAKSRRMLNTARLVEPDTSFIQGAETLSNNLGGIAAQAEQLQTILISLARYATGVTHSNDALAAVATALGYTLP